MALWTPADLGTAFIAGYRADQSSEITQSGGLVSQWSDWSGSGRHITQATSSKQPGYGANALASGYPGLTFNGVDEGLGNTSFGLPDGTVVHVFAVMIFDNSAPNNARFVTLKADGYTETQGFIPFLKDDNRSNLASFIDSNYVGVQAISSLDPLVASSVHQSGANNVYKNGTAGTPRTLTYPTRTFIELQVGQLPGGNSGENAKGVMSEVVIVSGTMTTDIREKCEGYLAHKWGLAANLPSGHTYKSAAPTTGAAPSVAPASSTHLHTASGPSLAANSSIQPLSSVHSLVSGEPTLAGKSTVVPSSAAHTHVSTQPTLTAKSTLAVNSAAHTHTASQPTLSTVTTTAPASAYHEHTAGEPSLTTPSIFTIYPETDDHTAWSEAASSSGAVNTAGDFVHSTSSTTGELGLRSASGTFYSYEHLLRFDTSGVPGTFQSGTFHFKVNVINNSASGTNNYRVRLRERTWSTPQASNYVPGDILSGGSYPLVGESAVLNTTGIKSLPLSQFQKLSSWSMVAHEPGQEVNQGTHITFNSADAATDKPYLRLVMLVAQPVAPHSAHHIHAAGEPTLSWKGVVAPASAYHAHVSSSPTIITPTQPDSAVHAVASTSPTLAAKSTVQPASTYHLLPTTEPSLAAKSTISPDSGYHLHTATQPVTTIGHMYPHPTVHTHTVSQPTIAAFSSVQVHSTYHLHDAGTPISIWRGALTPASTLHDHAATSPALTPHAVAPPASTTHLHTASQPTLAWRGVILVDDAYHLLTSSQPEISSFTNPLPSHFPRVMQRWIEYRTPQVFYPTEL